MCVQGAVKQQDEYGKTIIEIWEKKINKNNSRRIREMIYNLQLTQLWHFSELLQHQVGKMLVP